MLYGKVRDRDPRVSARATRAAAYSPIGLCHPAARKAEIAQDLWGTGASIPPVLQERGSAQRVDRRKLAATMLLQ